MLQTLKNLSVKHLAQMPKILYINNLKKIKIQIVLRSLKMIEAIAALIYIIEKPDHIIALYREQALIMSGFCCQIFEELVLI